MFLRLVLESSWIDVLGIRAVPLTRISEDYSPDLYAGFIVGAAIFTLPDRAADKRHSS